MALTVNENGQALTETVDGVTIPADSSFATVNDFVHGTYVQFEDLQCLCLGLASELDKLKADINNLKQVKPTT